MDLNGLARVELKPGGHASPAEGLCAMEAVALLEGLEHSARPACTCPVVSAFVRRANDHMPPDQRQRLVSYAPRLAGTVSLEAERPRADWVAGFTLQMAVPEMLFSLGLSEAAVRLISVPEGDWAVAIDAVDAVRAKVQADDPIAARALLWAGLAASWARSGAREWAAASAASSAVWSARASRAARPWEGVFDALEGMLAIGPAGRFVPARSAVLAPRTLAAGA